MAAQRGLPTLAVGSHAVSGFVGESLKPFTCRGLGVNDAPYKSLGIGSVYAGHVVHVADG